MKRGDAIFTASARDEREHGWVSYKAPKGHRFVFLLLGTVEKDAYDFDVDGSLNRLGWVFDPKSARLPVPEREPGKDEK